MPFIKRIMPVLLSMIIIFSAACSRGGNSGDSNISKVNDVDVTGEAAATASAESSVLTQTPETAPVPDGKTAKDSTAPDEPYVPVDIETLKKNFPSINGSIMTTPITEALFESILGIETATAKKLAIHNSNSIAYEKLANGSADVLFVTYPTKEDKELIAKLGLELTYIPLAKDALVFSVNIFNPLSNVTLDELRDIYSGKTTSWKSLGGTDAAITAFQNPSNSYEQTLLLNLLMSDIAPMLRPMRKITTEKGIVADVVSSYDNAINSIGFSTYYFASRIYAAAEQKMLTIDSVPPEVGNITTGKYPLTCSIYAAYRSDITNVYVTDLINWLLSPEGQQLISDSGYVPIKSNNQEAGT